MWRSTRFRIVPAAMVIALVSGCAPDPAGQDLCAQYADVKAAAEEFRAAPPLSTDNAEDFQASVDELRERADTVSDQLDQLQQVSEGRLDTAISSVRQRAAEVKQSLAVATYEAAATLGPQVEAAQEELDAAFAQLDQRVQTQCPAG
ncbi:hypothetical protein GCM10023168_29990 [Fodinibacter luteus]|uniref:Uncharacterized protein n=1 Tax=Fodinibacter luteus TaxID=552064 RepID=A0ABP8KLU3_9MICO